MKRPQPPAGPPRLLLGVALLFWGGITDHAFTGLLLALFVEAAFWTRIRWEFRDPAYIRAWHLCALLLLFIGTFTALEGSILDALPRSLVWLPVIFAPLQFVQSYGMADRIPLTTFSAMARRRRSHALRHQLPFRAVSFSFGNVYLPAILLAAALGSENRSPAFFPGVVVIAGWAYLASARRESGRLPASATLLVLIAAIGGFFGAQGISLLERLFDIEHERARLSYDQRVRTAIGQLGEVKQSREILWRIRPIEGPYPRLLRVAAYNDYSHAVWEVEPPPDIPRDSSFEELDSVGVENPFRVTARDEGEGFVAGDVASRESLSRFELRGDADQETLLPIPDNSASLVLPAQNLEINPFGTLRIEPEYAAVAATVLHGEPLDTGLAPWASRYAGDDRRDAVPPDLSIPADEREVVARVARELDLLEVPLREKIRRLRTHFSQNFEYTRYLGRGQTPPSEVARGFVGSFLEVDRRGHCEYFATATALLLREAGVPTRYATGFAVIEADGKTREATIRGTHGHAWCLAWDEQAGDWIDVDLTPASWVRIEKQRMDRWQGLLDWVDRFRVDFLIWRNQPGNLATAFAIVSVPFLGVGFFIFRRLWRSHRRIDPGLSEFRRNFDTQSPLDTLEAPAARVLGPRPPGQALAHWLSGLPDELADRGQLDRALALHRRLRFDPGNTAGETREELRQLVAGLRRALRSRRA